MLMNHRPESIHFPLSMSNYIYFIVYTKQSIQDSRLLINLIFFFKQYEIFWELCSSILSEININFNVNILKSV